MRRATVVAQLSPKPVRGHVIQEEQAIKLVALVVAVLLAALWAEWLSAFLMLDACLDAGGVYDSATGACMVQEGAYVGPFARSDRYMLWLFFLSAVTAPALGVYYLVVRFVERILRMRPVTNAGTRRPR